MKQPLTIKLKLQTSPEQFQALRATQVAYRDALNYISRYAFEHGKMSKARLQPPSFRYEIKGAFLVWGRARGLLT